MVMRAMWNQLKSRVRLSTFTWHIALYIKSKLLHKRVKASGITVKNPTRLNQRVNNLLNKSVRYNVIIIVFLVASREKMNEIHLSGGKI